MIRNEYVRRTFTVQGLSGTINVAENSDGDVDVSVGGLDGYVRMSREQFYALCSLQYDLYFKPELESDATPLGAPQLKDVSGHAA